MKEIAGTISVVVPVFNEANGLRGFHEQLITALIPLSRPVEILYINDGSTDQTRGVLESLRALDPKVGVANFSRNFGKEAAMTAGLNLARGEAVILIDADLQDPPRLIPEMVQAWEGGADVVTMRRRSRAGETWFKTLSAFAFYRVFNMVSDTSMPADVGDFRLLSRRVVDAINQLPERNRFMKGLFAWVGFKNVMLEYDRDARAQGTTKWGVRKLWRFAVEGIVGFSTVPLKLATYVGLSCALASFVYAVYFLMKTAFFGEPIHGFPTLIISILILGGLQLTAIGILGEYVSRLFIEAKGRPLYLIEEFRPALTAPPLWTAGAGPW
jgi:glycosyltransferase involved in cell wall biosynthesis